MRSNHQIDLNTAREIAERFLSENVRPSESDVVIIDADVVLEAIGWVFPYQTRSYLESGKNPLAGNFPLVIDQSNGSVRYLTRDEARSRAETFQESETQSQ